MLNPIRQHFIFIFFCDSVFRETFPYDIKSYIFKCFQQHAQEIARQNVREFLSKESLTKKDWDYISNVPSLTPIGGPDGTQEPPSMSPLNKYMQKERRESMDKTAQGGLENNKTGYENRAVQTQESREYLPLHDITLTV